MNQLVYQEQKNDVTKLSYDKRGNLIKKDTKNKNETFKFDATNHMVKGINEKDHVSQYTYNALFMRVNNTQATKNCKSYSRDYVIDYNSAKRNDLNSKSSPRTEREKAWMGYASMIPGIGVVVSLVDFSMSMDEGDYKRAAHSLAGALGIPGLTAVLNIESFMDSTMGFCNNPPPSVDRNYFNPSPTDISTGPASSGSTSSNSGYGGTEGAPGGVTPDAPNANSAAADKAINDARAANAMNGNYGNGDERKELLGKDYAETQKRVNELMGVGAQQGAPSNSGNGGGKAGDGPKGGMGGDGGAGGPVGSGRHG